MVIRVPYLLEQTYHRDTSQQVKKYLDEPLNQNLQVVSAHIPKYRNTQQNYDCVFVK